MSDERASAPKATVLVYSDDRTVREQVRFALGRKVAADLPEIEIFECATQPAVVKAVDAGGIDAMILDAEAVPAGGMGVSRTIQDEVADPPPIVLLVARVADAWLATWARADAILVMPVDPELLPVEVARVLRDRLSVGSNRQ